MSDKKKITHSFSAAKYDDAKLRPAAGGVYERNEDKTVGKRLDQEFVDKKEPAAQSKPSNQESN